MRDPNRLDNIYNNLKELHKYAVTDWRLGQLMLNFMSWYYNKYKKDIFYIEDDKIVKVFREFIDDMGIKYA